MHRRLASFAAIVLLAGACEGGAPSERLAEGDPGRTPAPAAMASAADENGAPPLVAESQADGPRSQGPGADLSSDDENVVADPPAGDSGPYLVFVQPSPTSLNPLYTATSSFIQSHRLNNEAALYPPHITVLGKFTSPFSESDVLTKIGQLAASKRPMGQPKVQSVVCSSGLVTLHFSLPSPYTTLGGELMKVLKAKPLPNATNPIDKKSHHLTLYESAGLPNLERAADIACNDAHQILLPNQAFRDFYNQNNFPENAWDIALYRPPTATGMAQQVGNGRWRANP